MYKAERILSIKYVESHKIEKQGTFESIVEYLKEGYVVKQQRNENYWILAMPVRVIVTVDCGKGRIHTFDMRAGILGKYKRRNISKKLVKVFFEDFSNGLLDIYVEERSRYYSIL